MDGKILIKLLLSLQNSTKVPYSVLFSRGKIFANFLNRKQFVKILPLKSLLFNRYSLQSVTIRENFPLEKLGIAQFVKISPLKNNPLYIRYLSSKKGKHIKTGAGRPSTYPKDIDESVIAWVLRQRDLHLPVQRLELKLKARALICPTLPNFKASSGRVEKFMRRQSLSLRLECHTIVIRLIL